MPERKGLLDVLALSVSIAAFGLAIFQGIQTREHNKMSVIPALAFINDESWANYEDGLGIWVQNHGVGPAIIQDFSVYVDCQKIDGAGLTIWHEAVRKLDVNHSAINFRAYSAGNVLKVAYDEPIFWIDPERGNQQLAGEIFLAMKRVIVVIDYKSIYGEEHQSATVNDWPDACSEA